MDNKKVLIIGYDTEFSSAVLGALEEHNINSLLAEGLSDGSKLFQEENPGLVIIECPVSLTTDISKLISSFDSNTTSLILVSKEKRFLEDFNGESIYKFNFDEISTVLKSKVLELIG